MLVLRFVTGKYSGRDFPLEESRSFIAGRSTEADLVLADDAVSRKHARFYPARGRIWVRDLGSRNGTVINGTAASHHCLRPGDRIAIGSSLARFADVEPTTLSRERAGERVPAGADVAGRSMSGRIEDIPLMDVLQWLATSRKTGTLRVRGNSTGELFLRQGRVYYARIEGSGNLKAEKALLRMMGWSEGTFELDSAVVEPPDGKELSVGLEHILMEAARVQDELAHLAERQKIPDGAVALIIPSGKDWRELGPEQIDIVQAVAEGHDWPTILDRLQADDVALTRTAIELAKAGVIRY